MATVVALQHRKSQCWITSFVEATAHVNSPAIFRKWAALNALSACVERKVYLSVQHRKLFPNLFTFLVGPPGSGKTTAIKQAKDLLEAIPRLHLSPAKVTKEKLVSLIMQTIQVDPEIESMAHMSINCFIDDISTFLPPHDIDFAITLTDLYDCPEHWHYSLISRNDTILDHVYITIIGGITPKMVAESLGQRSLGLGFTSRVIFVYCEDTTRQDPFPEGNPPDISFLRDDLVKIHEIRGPYTITTETVTAFRKWYYEGMPPVPSDSRFSEYIPRRHIHLLKLALLIAAGRRDKREITLEDYEFAKELLLEAEETMPIALEDVGQNPMIDAMRRVQRWALVEYKTNGKQPLHESIIRRKLLGSGIQANYLESTIGAMLTSCALTHITGTWPNRLFVPEEHQRG